MSAKKGMRAGLESQRTDGARAKARALRDSRIDHIVGMMTGGRWRGSASHRDLSQQWGVSIGCVGEYAVEASSLIRRSVSGDLEALRTQILAGVEHVRRVAMRLQKYVKTGSETYEPHPTPDVKAALASYELQAKMLGLLVERRQEVTPDRMTPQERAEDLKSLRAELEAEERRVEEELKGAIQ